MTPFAGGCEGVTGLELSTQQRDPPQNRCRRHLPSPRLADPPRRRRRAEQHETWSKDDATSASTS